MFFLCVISVETFKLKNKSVYEKEAITRDRTIFYLVYVMFIKSKEFW